MKKIMFALAAIFIMFFAIILAIDCGKDKSTDPSCYTLTFHVQGSGHVEAEPGLSCYYDTTHIVIGADPDPGWEFVGWSGDYSGSQLEATIVLSKDSEITATFEQTTYSLSVSINPAGSGSVTKDPDQASYHLNDIVTLTATPAGGYDFLYWSGDISEDDVVTNVTITANTSVTANFGIAFTQENEPDCGTNYVDNFNGGCNSSPYVYSTISNGQAIEGTSGTFSYNGTPTRDTDWYRYVAGGNRILNFIGVADFALQICILDLTGGCDNLEVLECDAVSAGDTAYVSATVAAGTYAMWVGPQDYTGWPCPVDYRIWFTATSAAEAEVSPVKEPVGFSIGENPPPESEK